MADTTDVLGRPISETDARMLFLYEELKALLADEALDASSAANLRQALAAVWNIVNNRALVFEQLHSVSV